MGASAGGLEVLKEILGHLPKEFSASIFIVWHMGPDVQGILPDIINNLHTIPAANAIDHEPILSNRIYVAPPDRHMVLEYNKIKVIQGQKESRFRPSVDTLFRSAAYAYGNRVIGMVLSGGLDDGAAGLRRIKLSAGVTIVQDPTDAEVSSMPESAMQALEVDYCLPSSDLAPLLIDLISHEIEDDPALAGGRPAQMEMRIPEQLNALSRESPDSGVLSSFSCPACKRVLSRMADGNMVRFQCSNGHAYSTSSLMLTTSEDVEKNMYNVLHGMDECIMLLNHIGDDHAENNRLKLAADYFNMAKDVLERTNLLHAAACEQQKLGQRIFKMG